MLAISNNHSPECGKPPIIKSNNETYVAYFENMLGEQIIFSGDRHTKVAVMYSGYHGWFPLYLDGKKMIPRVILREEEQSWLMGCWSAFLRIPMTQMRPEWDKQTSALVAKIDAEIEDMA